MEALVIGRMVHYWRGIGGGQPCPAVVTYVFKDEPHAGKVSLQVFDPNGGTYALTAVPQKAADVDANYGVWDWPPRA